jgi:hypothetical protein
MRLPQIKNPDKYVDLYIVDFGDRSGVGFTADEVAELLESEKYKDVKIYRIYNAYPDGKMELKGVPNQIFQLEAGMLFYEFDEAIAKNDYKTLIKLAVSAAPPARAKVHLAEYNSGKFVTALIYPAEYGDLFGRWLLDIGYKTAGPAEGGIEVVKRYYADTPQILQRHQLFGQQKFESKTGEELLAMTKMAVVR